MSSSFSFAARSVASPVAKLVEVTEVSGVLLLEPVGDLGEPGMAGDERRRARGGSLGSDHPERLGEDRGHDGRVGQRQQVDEVAMLERAGEEDVRPSEALELLAVVAEADDHRARVDLAQRLEQDVDALVVEELAEVDDRRLRAGEERGEPLGVAVVGQALVLVPRVRRIAPCLLDEAGERLGARPRPPVVDVDPGRYLVDVLDVADDLVEHRADVFRADEDGSRLLERLPPPLGELGTPAQRVLELGAVRLDRERRSRRRSDRPAEEDVVGEDDVGRQVLAQRRGVRLDPALELLPRAVLDELHVVALVAVEHEDGQEPAHVRPHDARRSRGHRAPVAPPG